MKGNPPISRQRLYQLDHKKHSLARGVKRSANTKYNRLKGKV